MKKNTWKRFWAYTTSAAMAGAMAIAPVIGTVSHPVVTMATSAAAVPGTSGEQRDVSNLLGTITVEGVNQEAGKDVKVKAYQIVDGYYNSDDKIVKYVLMDPTNAQINDFEKPTESEITTIANNIETGVFTADTGVELTKGDDGKYTGSVEPGLYMILVTGADAKVYNPAVVAVNITNANDNSSVTGTSVNMAQGFSDFGDPVGTVFLKKSESTMDKDITDQTRRTDTSDKGDTVAIGDTVSFSINDMTIPSFSGEYENPQFIITDTLDDTSFDGIKAAPTLSVGGTEMTFANGKYTKPDGTEVATLVQDDTNAFNAGGSKTFKISFNSAYLKSLRNTDLSGTDAGAGRKVIVTYQSSLASTAGLNFAENHNRATLQYSNNPNNVKSYKTINKDTYHYTFGLDASIDGENSTGDEETHELNKVKSASSETDYENGEGITTKKTTKKSKSALANAVFQLYSDPTCRTPVTKVQQTDAKATSDENGHISFTGLDEGTYYLKEITAPSGYTIDDHVYQITITPTLDGTTGVMTSYSVTTKRAQAQTADALASLTAASFTEEVGSATYTATQTTEDDGSITNTEISKTVTPMEVVDTKLQSLPSTGAKSALIITILGVTVIAGVTMATKKKDEDVEA